MHPVARKHKPIATIPACIFFILCIPCSLLPNLPATPLCSDIRYQYLTAEFPPRFFRLFDHLGMPVHFARIMQTSANDHFFQNVKSEKC
jgi:hypothetical protein